MDNWVYLLVSTWPFSGLNSWNEKQRPLGHVQPLSSSERLLKEANVGRKFWGGPVGGFPKRSNKFLFFNITCCLVHQGPKNPASFSFQCKILLYIQYPSCTSITLSSYSFILWISKCKIIVCWFFLAKISLNILWRF